MRKMQPLDFIKTNEGGYIGIITEVSTTQGIYTASVEFVGGPYYTTSESGGLRMCLKSAWWDSSEFEIIDSLPDLLSRKVKHAFGTGSLQPFKLPKKKKKKQ